MNLGRSLLRYSTAKGIRASGGSYGLGRALSLILVPWRTRKPKP